MIKGRELIKVNKEIWIQLMPSKPAISAKITKLEENIFWINLPKDGHQVLVLQEKQEVYIRLATPDGMYNAMTTVNAIGGDYDYFYGLAIPETFTITQQRKYQRANLNANIVFQVDDLSAQTIMVNFSAGGMMVFMVKQLNDILKQKNRATVYFSINNEPYIIDVRLVWKKRYNNIWYAGFKFQNIPSGLQDKLNRLANSKEDLCGGTKADK
ncbi:MAG: PilZ domain-containing protein [Bacillota bacterium]